MTFIPSQDWYQKVAQELVPDYKIVDKSGRNSSVGISMEPIISLSLGGSFWTPTSASTVRIKAGGDANDSSGGTGARAVTVEGLDSNYALASESITTNGASASSATSTSFRRIFRAYVTDVGTYGGRNTAEIMIENSGGGTDIITVDFHNLEGQGESLHCQYSSPNGSTVWLLGLKYEPDGTKSNDVHVHVTDRINQTTAPFGATRNVLEFQGVTNPIVHKPVAPQLLNLDGSTSPMDIWVAGEVSASTSIVSAQMQLLLFTG